MPIDINRLRPDKGGDPEEVRKAQQARGKPASLVDDVLALDGAWRERVTAVSSLRQELSRLQKEVIAPKKKRKEECEAEVAESRSLQQRLKEQEGELQQTEEARHRALSLLGNALDPSVVLSQDEGDNEVISLWQPSDAPPGPERLLAHEDLLWRIGGYEPERGQRVAGDRAYFLRDAGLLLTQALQSFALSFLRKRGYSLVQPPFFMKREVMASVAQLADFDEQLYKVVGRSAEEPEKYLIATSEQPMCAFHAKEVLDESELPLRYAAVSPCFRREVGKMGEDIRGIFRVHQFEKVEQFCITKGSDEESREAHREMLKVAEDFHRALKLPYRVVSVVSGELNDAACAKFDLEGWFPCQGTYRELVSCSNCTDFQARALDVRCKSREGQLSHVHMLNSTLTATGRGLCCILENYQTAEGVRVPEALRPFMDGSSFLPFLRGAKAAK